MAFELIALSDPNLEFTFHSGGEKDIGIEMGHASEFAMVGVHKIVVFAELEIVHSDVLVVRIRVFFGVVNEFVFLVVEVVLTRRVGQAVLEDVSQLLRLAAEVQKVYDKSVPHRKKVFVV